jgi:hypothetical protein
MSLKLSISAPSSSLRWWLMHCVGCPRLTCWAAAISLPTGSAILPLKRGRQQRRHERQHRRHGGRAQVLQEVQPHAGLRTFHHYHTDQFVTAAHCAVDPHGGRPGRSAALGAEAGRHRCGQLGGGGLRRRCCGGDVACQQLAVAVVQGCLQDVVLDRQRGQRLLSLLAVGVEQRGLAVVADHAGQRGQLLAFIVGVAEHRGDGKRDEHQHQRAAGGQHGNDSQFLTQAGTFKVEHGVGVQSVGAAS